MIIRMNTRKVRNHILLLYQLLMILPLVGILAAGCQDAPQSSFEKARFEVQQAAEAGALKYAETDFRRAQNMLREGQMEMARQNGRLAPLRNYHQADSLFSLTVKIAGEAAEKARKRIEAMKAEAGNEIEQLKKQLTSWREALDGSLVMYDAESHWSKAEMALKISEKLYRDRQYRETVKAVADGYQSLSQISRILDDYANDAAGKTAVWNRWVRETVDESRKNGSPAIIVDKSAHKLYLLKNGKLTRTFDCELGYNSARQKYLAGDGATPEGKYRIIQAKHNGSKYYKALLLDYPNQNDKKRFAENKKKNVIADHARIGGLIEIHGDGGQNQDWTDGCVALTNGEMDFLMAQASVGTPVTIVRRSEQWP
nr:L,D-transpeptidase family protein [candidate division Zixibacteria bacterium]